MNPTGSMTTSEMEFRWIDLSEESTVSFFLKSLPKNFLGADSGVEARFWKLSRKFLRSLLISKLPRLPFNLASRDMVGVIGVLNDTIDNGRDVRPSGGDVPSEELELVGLRGLPPGTGSQTSHGSRTPTPAISTWRFMNYRQHSSHDVMIRETYLGDLGVGGGVSDDSRLHDVMYGEIEHWLDPLPGVHDTSR